jgi:double-stranded uracil-DNA glycosylase
VAKIVTPNEIAAQFGVTGLRFRNWLREQKTAGHPLVASHEYRTHYQFPQAEADQLAAEFAEQVLRPRSGAVGTSAPARRRKRAGRAGARSASKTAGLTYTGAQVDYPRSDDPGHRVMVEWMGEEVETLADLLRPGLRAVAVGINPAPKSVAAGHYYQGNYGQTFFRRLSKAGLLPDGPGFEDDRAFAAGAGFTDVVKRPTAGKRDLRAGELEHGRPILEAKLTKLDVPLAIFVFKSAAETLLGALPPGFYGLVPRRRLGKTRVFVMPRPTAARPIESDAIEKLKRALRAQSSSAAAALD